MTQKVLEAAFQIAFEAHKGEFRKGPKAHRRTIPYIIHSVDVVKRMTNWGIYCPITLGAGVLHDAPESHPGEDLLSRLEKLCPDTALVKPIIKAVEELTYIPESQWKDNFPKKKWKDKGAYLASFMTASIPALTVKVSDRICHVWDDIHIGSEHVKKYFQAAECLFEAMILRKADLINQFTTKPIDAMFMDYEYLRSGVTD